MKGKTNKKPEIVGWTGWKTAKRRIEKGEYIDDWDLTKKEYKEIRAYLVEYLLLNSRIVTKEHNKKWVFNGYYHQGASNGVPVIKYNNNLYAFTVTMRRWGDIIAEVLSKIDGVKYEPIDKIEKKLGNLKDDEKLTEEGSYSYLDFAWTWERHKGGKDMTFIL